MDLIKKYFGIVWLALGAYAAYFLIVKLGFPKITSPSSDDNIFGWIILIILTPIIVGGLFIFGRYCISGEYEEK